MSIAIDAVLDGVPLAKVGGTAADAERAGAAGAWIGEVNTDPFLTVAMAAEHTERLQVGTSVAIAFARSPMTVAMTAHEIQGFSNGRLLLGLGTQVKAHVTRRFSMPWTRPAARMREYVLALHAIWDAWREGSRLDFAGEFYTHTLMSPMFVPAPHGLDDPKIIVAGVGERMVQVAGEVGDGLFVHPFSSPEYVATHILPSFEAGAKEGGRSLPDLIVAGALLTATGQTPEAIAAATADARRQVAFYASTPAYRAVLDTHGWGDVQDEVATLVRAGRWNDLGSVLSDEMLHAFALVGPPAEVARQLHERWDGVFDRVSLVAPNGVDPASWKQIHDAVAA